MDFISTTRSLFNISLFRDDYVDGRTDRRVAEGFFFTTVFFLLGILAACMINRRASLTLSSVGKAFITSGASKATFFPARRSGAYRPLGTMVIFEKSYSSRNS